MLSDLCSTHLYKQARLPSLLYESRLNSRASWCVFPKSSVKHSLLGMCCFLSSRLNFQQSQQQCWRIQSGQVKSPPTFPPKQTVLPGTAAIRKTNCSDQQRLDWSGWAPRRLPFWQEGSLVVDLLSHWEILTNVTEDCSSYYMMSLWGCACVHACMFACVCMCWCACICCAVCYAREREGDCIGRTISKNI